MARRVSLPTADDLFRKTADTDDPPEQQPAQQRAEPSPARRRAVAAVPEPAEEPKGHAPAAACATTRR